MPARSFSTKELEILGDYYVYAYYDPDGGITPFYIGKGRGNRAFAHLNDCLKKRGEDILEGQIDSDPNDCGETAKIAKINEILDRGKEPRIDILAHGLSENEAFAVETAMIDCFRPYLTNKQSGMESEDKGRITLGELKLRANAVPLSDEEKKELEGKTLLLNIKETYGEALERHKNESGYTPSYEEIYEMTRRAWPLRADRLKNITKVFAVYAGQIVEVFDVSADLWTRDDKEKEKKALPETGAPGMPRPNADNDKYKGRLVDEYCGQNPVRYI